MASSQGEAVEALAIPLLGRVAAGLPIEGVDHNEYIDVPPSLVRNPSKSFALKVEGQSMIEDGIFDSDTILIQKQKTASNGETVVATIENEATVKRFYSYKNITDKLKEQIDYMPDVQTGEPLIELRPANSTMKSLWYPASKVNIEGIVVGLVRQF